MEPYKIYDFEDEKAWLKGRLNGIGGSDASAVVGKNPYKTNIELFEEKTGRRIAPDISEKPYVIYGKEAEQYIRELFRLDYPQYQVMHHEYRILQSLDYPFMQASLDGELVDQDGRKGILEIKTTNILQSMQYEKWKDRIPDNYYIQVLHYLLVTGYEFVVLRAHLRSNWGTDVRTQVKHYFIERTEVQADLDYLQEEEIKFWKYSGLVDERNREELMRADAIVNEFQFDRYYDQERFLIELQANFIESDDLTVLKQVAGNIQSGTTANYDDDGVSQKTTIKSGIANKTDVIVPNPVKLRPYRTFAEIEQPQSSYVFRIQDSDRGPSFKLVEADGGLWKNATMKKIKEYLAYELAEELEKYNITIIA